MTASVFVGTSVDGFIARSNGALDWLPEGGGEPHGYDEFVATVDAIVIGRNTFIGAGNTFTDYNLVPAPIRALSGAGELEDSNRPVLGGCVGHNCRIGSGLIVYPSRTIESDVVLFASADRRVIANNISYEESDHHHARNGLRHQRLYPRLGEEVAESW